MRRNRRICLRYSTEPSIFYGGLGEGIKKKKSFAQIGKRFTFGGDTGWIREFTIFNTKEIPGTNSEHLPHSVPRNTGRKFRRQAVG